MNKRHLYKRPVRYTKLWFRAYGHSDTCDALAEAVDGKRLKLKGSKYRKHPGDVLVNWGSTKPFDYPVDLNKPENVTIATSKMATFLYLQNAGIPIPRWTQDKAEVLKWKEKVVGRDLDSGRSGRGIVVYKKDQEVGNHLFYTEYFRKDREFRIHVFRGKVIFEQEKLKRKDADVADNYIRSHDRGWCFAFHHLTERPTPAVAKDVAVAAVSTLGLDFGAVDIGWHKDNGAVVFEVNTAPGLEESSLEAYATAFRSLGE